MLYNKRLFKIIILTIVVILPYTFVNSNVGQASEERFNMSYLYFGGVESHINYVNQTNGALDVVSPSYFDLKPDGSLKLTTKLSMEFIKEMHKKNIEVVPFLSNHWNRDLGRKALANSEYLANQIAIVVQGLDLDGVNIDLENLTQEDREDYINFVKILREKIPEDKEVSVAVAANPNNLDIGWHGSYDYTQLAKYADYLMIMTYDESYYGSEPGPIASIDFVEKALEYALERVSSDKIVLGIPFYGRYWNLSEDKGGRGIHLTDLELLLDVFEAKTVFMEEAQSPVSFFEIEESNEAYYVYGRKLTPGVYTVWFENDESIKAKLKLVNKYNLKGTGSWSLGQELPNIWSYYTEVLNETSSTEDNAEWDFPDIENHWAQEDIIFAQKKGWMKGYDNGLFDPDSSLTRAQAAATIVRVFNLEKQGEVVDDFVDVAENHWAKNEISIAKEHGIINGIDNKSFVPDRPVTREEMAVMLNRILDFEADTIELTEPLFNDVEEESWSYEGIYTMTIKGLFEGCEDGSFRPTENLTRAQMATLLNRITKYID